MKQGAEWLANALLATFMPIFHPGMERQLRRIDRVADTMIADAEQRVGHPLGPLLDELVDRR